jgi:hypothetical protein
LPLPPPSLFRSFWIGGYESACHKNHAGERLDMVAGVQHDAFVGSDYALLKTEGMQTARDAVRWHLVDQGKGTYDFSSFTPMLEAAIHQGIQVIWDLCHYGWPDDIDLLSPAFIDRFAHFSGAIARHVREHSDEVPFYSPINEISFFCWGAARGFMFPYLAGRDNDIKRQLIRACVASVEAIRLVDRRARFVYPEPTIHVVAPPGRPDFQRNANAHVQSQYEAWDMVGGWLSPELGGRPDYLDILGSNFYATNEWRTENDARIPWDSIPPDPQWRPLHLLLEDLWIRYQRPFFLAETSHIGEGRGKWISEVAREVYLARQNDIPVEGICLYPVVDRYDWGNAEHWHHSGLWDLRRNPSGALERVLNRPYAAELRAARVSLGTIGCL